MRSVPPLRTALRSLLLLLIPAMAGAAVDPVAALPADTMVCISVLHPEKLAALAEHPVSRAVKLGGMKEIFGKLVAGALDEKQRKVWQEECGMPPEKIVKQFSGSLAAGIFGVEMVVKRGAKDQMSVEFGVVAGFDGDEALVTGIFKTLLRLHSPADSPDKKGSKDEDDEDQRSKSGALSVILTEKEQIEEYKGAKLHIHAPEKRKDEDIEAVAWCVHEKTLFVATGGEPLRGMLDRATGGKASPSFSESKVWKTACDETGDPDAVVVWDVAMFFKLFRAISDDPPRLKLFHTLGLEKLEVASMGVRSDPKGIELKMSCTCSSMPAMFSMFPQGSGREAPPAFLPGNLRGITWSPVDLKEMARAFIKFMPDVTPMSRQQIETTLSSLKQAFGVDIEKEVIDHLGTGYFQADHGFGDITIEDITGEEDVGQQINIVSPSKEGSVMGFKVTDARAVENALRTLVPKFAKGKVELDAREYMGFKIHRIGGAKTSSADDADAPRPVEYSLAIADDWVLFATGRQELLERILGLIKNPAPDHLWKRQDVQRGFDSLAPGGIYTRYEDMNDGGRGMIVLVQGLLPSIFPGVPGMESLRKTDPADLLKGVAFPIHHFEKVFIEPRAIRAVTRFVVRPDAE